MTVKYIDKGNSITAEGIPSAGSNREDYLNMIKRHGKERSAFFSSLLEQGWVMVEHGTYGDACRYYYSPALIAAEKAGLVELDSWGTPEQPGWEDHYIRW